MRSEHQVAPRSPTALRPRSAAAASKSVTWPPRPHFARLLFQWHRVRLRAKVPAAVRGGHQSCVQSTKSYREAPRHFDLAALQRRAKVWPGHQGRTLRGCWSNGTGFGLELRCQPRSGGDTKVAFRAPSRTAKPHGTSTSQCCGGEQKCGLATKAALCTAAVPMAQGSA